MAARHDPRMHAYDEQGRFSGMIYMLMLVVALAFGGFLWQLYSGPETPHIAARPGPYKSAPVAESPPDIAEAEIALAGDSAADADPELAVAGAPPTPLGGGPFVAQIAALQSAAAADVAWRRLSSRAPNLLATVQLDVERADLGQRGVYYRVRAGYFADRERASQFCEQIKQMGQDCIATAR